MIEVIRNHDSDIQTIAALDELNENLEHQLQDDPYRYMLASLLLPALDVVTRMHFTMVAKRRLTATAAAIRLYEIDHGRRPDRLEDLVPTYLPAVPIDPWSLTEQTLRYKPQGGVVLSSDDIHRYENNPEQFAPQPGTPAMLYSVGPNQHDDGGLIFVEDDGIYDEEYNQKFGDISVLLDPQPKPTRDPQTP